MTEHEICEACKRGRHDHCAAQVPASGARCNCSVCWGECTDKASMVNDLPMISAKEALP